MSPPSCVLAPRDLHRDVGAEDLAVVPRRVGQRARHDPFLHRVDVVGVRVAGHRRPDRGEPLVGAPAEQQRVAAQEQLGLELPVAAVALVLAGRPVLRVLDNAVERDVGRVDDASHAGQDDRAAARLIADHPLRVIRNNPRAGEHGAHEHGPRRRDRRRRGHRRDHHLAAPAAAADPALPARDPRRAGPRRDRRVAARRADVGRHRAQRALPELRQGARHLLPGDRVPLDAAQLDEPLGLPRRAVPLLLPAGRRARVRAVALARDAADLPEHVRVLLHRLRGAADALRPAEVAEAFLGLGGRGCCGSS